MSSAVGLTVTRHDMGRSVNRSIMWQMKQRKNDGRSMLAPSYLSAALFRKDFGVQPTGQHFLYVSHRNALRQVECHRISQRSSLSGCIYHDNA